MRATRLWTLLLVAITLLPALGPHIHPGYFAVVVPAGLTFLALVCFVPAGLTRVRWARRVFFASMPYLVAIYAAYVAAT
jgi:protoheme IX farnesyltransferase